MLLMQLTLRNPTSILLLTLFLVVLSFSAICQENDGYKFTPYKSMYVPKSEEALRAQAEARAKSDLIDKLSFNE